MVAKRGRGARNQAAKGKAADDAAQQPAVVGDEGAEAEPAAAASADENNGDAEPMEHEAAESVQEGAELAADGAPDAASNQLEAQAEPENKTEEKVESGKLLVENLPSSYLFDYQEKLKEIFSKYGEVISVKRGPIIVTELTTTPTLSAIVEFKNKESLDKAVCEDGRVEEGRALSVACDSRGETAVLVGVPYEASNEYVRLLFTHCGPVAHIHEFSKSKYKILRVTFQEKESVEKALKLDRELRINGFLVTVSRFRDDDEQKAHNANVNKKRQHSGQQNRNSNVNVSGGGGGGGAGGAGNSPNGNRNNSFRPRGGAFNARGNFRGARGRGGFGRGGGGAGFPRGGFAPLNYMPPQGFMARPGGFMDGQRPNKRLRQV